MSVLIIAGSF